MRTHHQKKHQGHCNTQIMGPMDSQTTTHPTPQEDMYSLVGKYSSAMASAVVQSVSYAFHTAFYLYSSASKQVGSFFSTPAPAHCSLGNEGGWEGVPAFQDMHTSCEWAVCFACCWDCSPPHNRLKDSRCLAIDNQQVPQAPLQKRIP